MEAVFKCIVSDKGKEFVNDLVESILSTNPEQREIIKKMTDAVVFVRHTTKHPDGIAVLKFQEKDARYGKLKIPKISENKKSRFSGGKEVGPGRHVIWSMELDEYFSVAEPKGLKTEIVYKEEQK